MHPVKCSLARAYTINSAASVLTLERISGEAGSHHSEISNCHFPRYTRAFTRPWYPCRHGARCIPGELAALTDSRSQARHCGRYAPPPIASANHATASSPSIGSLRPLHQGQRWRHSSVINFLFSFLSLVLVEIPLVSVGFIKVNSYNSIDKSLIVQCNNTKT